VDLPRNAKHLKILLAEDTGAMRMLLVGMLRHAGFESVRTASSADLAFDALRRETPDILITDLLGLEQGGDGLGLVRRVRRDPLSPNPMLPIILLTAKAQAPKVLAARDAGVDEILVKPVSVTAMQQRLYSLIFRPRSYVLNTDFVGPDRRRKPGEADDDRRGTVPLGEEGGPVVLPPARFLQAKVKGDPHLMEESSSALETAITKLRSLQIVQTAQEIEAIEDYIDQTLQDAQDALSAKRQVASRIHELAQRMTDLGQRAVARIAQSLQKFMEIANVDEPDSKTVEIHLQSMRAILRSAGHPAGDALATQLAEECENLVSVRAAMS